jgi:hypothetical protein
MPSRPKRPKKQPHKPLSHDTVKSIVGRVHAVLTEHEVTQPVQVRFAAAETGACWEYRCEPDAEGRTVCHMVQVPCGPPQDGVA